MNQELDTDNNGSNIIKETHQLSLQWHKHHDTLISLLNQAWKQQELVDVTLSAEGRCIEVHRIILCASSQYFQDILTQKNCSDKQAIFFLKDVDYEDLEALVHYMYKGEVRIDEHRLDSFLRTAKSLGVRGLSTYDDKQLPNEKDLTRPTSKIRKRKRSSTSSSSSKDEESNTSLTVGAEQEASNMVPKYENHLLTDDYSTSGPPPPYYTSQQLRRTDGHDSSLDMDNTNFTEAMRNGTVNTAEVNNLAGNSSSSGLLVNPIYFHDAKTNEFDGAALIDQNDTNRCDPDGRFSCARCGRLYKWKQARNRHLKYECGVKPQFSCPVCQTSFHYKNALQRHMETHNRHK